MNPASRAFQVYQDEESSHSFASMLELCLAEGYVLSTSRFFVAAREVSSKWDPRAIVDPFFWWHHSNNLTQNPDCWHIHLMAGEMAEAAIHFPHPHNLVSFERRNQLRFHEFHRFFRRSAFRPG